MAAPAEKTIRDLNGIWVLNKQLSDDMNLLLKLQNVSWLLRQAIILATISLHTTQTQTQTPTQTPTQTNDGGDEVTIITIQNVANGGVKGTTEVRHLDWQPREHRDYIWGHVRGRCGYQLTREVVMMGGDERLRTGWLEETLNGECIQNDIAAVDGSWQSSMIWGFESVNGERRFVRKVRVQRDQDRDQVSASIRLVYDYQGPTK